MRPYNDECLFKDPITRSKNRLGESAEHQSVKKEAATRWTQARYLPINIWLNIF